MNMPRYHWKRRGTQFVILLLLALVPILGLFRIDLASASFVILGHQIWWSNYSFLVGMAFVVATAPILTYMTIGSVFCGWACPQNLLSEWANHLTRKLLGKRADVRVGGEGLIVAASKNKAINWLILGLSFLAASLVLGLVVLMFFYTRSDMWSFIAGGEARQPSMLVMYLLTSLLIFIDIATVRYLYCDYPCLYRVGLRMFRSRDALHVTYDASRSSECEKCNYCATSCITDIQPTNIRITDTCVDCGECIDACDRLHAKSGTRGLLKFEIGESGSRMTWRKMLGKAFTRSKWLVVAFFLLGCAMMVWGGVTQKTVDQKKLLQEQQKIQRIAHVCNSQCAQLQTSCSGKNIAGCYRAAACKCACSLQQDPLNALADSWRQCVQSNTAHAQAMGTNLPLQSSTQNTRKQP